MAWRSAGARNYELQRNFTRYVVTCLWFLIGGASIFRACHDTIMDAFFVRYGLSDGSPSEKGAVAVYYYRLAASAELLQTFSGLRRDAQAALDYVLSQNHLGDNPVVCHYPRVCNAYARLEHNARSSTDFLSVALSPSISRAVTQIRYRH